jgi:hypothetical protein
VLNTNLSSEAGVIVPLEAAVSRDAVSSRFQKNKHLSWDLSCSVQHWTIMAWYLEQN